MWSEQRAKANIFLLKTRQVFLSQNTSQFRNVRGCLVVFCGRARTTLPAAAQANPYDQFQAQVGHKQILARDGIGKVNKLLNTII